MTELGKPHSGKNTPTNTIETLKDIMSKLLAPNGCPWDLEQTPKTLAPYAIEEAFELAEAIEREDVEGTIEELGDLLLQVVFHATLAQKKGAFSFDNVVDVICTKMVRRHPHVFGDLKVQDSDEVLKNWSKIKSIEKKSKPLQKGFGIPVAMPALQRAQKIGDKTKTLKFDWANANEVLEKVDEEILELKEALKSGDKLHAEEELGDVFFVLAQLARHNECEAETAARKANQKFEKRFERMSELAKEKNLDFLNLPMPEKEKLWIETKEILK